MFSDTDRLIRQANILLPDGHFFRGDVQIRQGKIARIAEAIAPASEDDILDVQGLTMFPGVFVVCYWLFVVCW